jgi:16S rRNA G1207 methylase RsmC
MYHVDVPFEGVGVGKALVAFLADVGTEFEMDHVDVSLQAIEISEFNFLDLIWNAVLSFEKVSDGYSLLNFILPCIVSDPQNPFHKSHRCGA